MSTSWENNVTKTGFSDEGSSIIFTKLNIDLNTVNESFTGQDYTQFIDREFEINKCSCWIIENEFKKVALQFPDHLLKYSAKVCELIQNKVNNEKRIDEMLSDCEVCILADTSYGSCCVDEVAAKHNYSDCLIHYGHSCLSPTQKFPVLYIFPKKEIDPKNFLSELLDLFTDTSSPCILWLNIAYHHVVGTIKALMDKSDVHFIIPTLDCNDKGGPVPENTKMKYIKHAGRTITLPNDVSFEQCPIVYVSDGSEDLSFVNLVINFTSNTFYQYNAASKILSKVNFSVNKMLMRRFHLIETAKDAKIVGILVGTLGVSNYLSIIEQIKSTLKAAGRRFYVFVMGKLNVAKLANFMEIDIYVLVACPLNSLIDSKEFYRPILTPYELEVAFNRNRQWASYCITDYSRILPGGDNYVPLPKTAEEETVDVSLISGRIRRIGIKEDINESIQSEDSCGALVNRDSKMFTVAQIHQDGAGSYLANRSWQGLEQKLGETEVTTTKEGRLGIPLNYNSEPKKLT